MLNLGKLTAKKVRQQTKCKRVKCIKELAENDKQRNYEKEGNDNEQSKMFKYIKMLKYIKYIDRQINRYRNGCMDVFTYVNTVAVYINR